MSAFKRISCSLKSKETLIKSLEELGFNPTISQEKLKLRGYMGDTREEFAEIIVPRNQISRLSNDLGFAYNTEKAEWDMICSDYDIHNGLGDKIKQGYAITAIKTALVKNKFTISSVTKEKDKAVTLVAEKII